MDWEVGDLAVCVDAEFYDFCGRPAVGPSLGSKHVVADVGFAPEGFVWIDLLGFGGTGMDARQFRKIRPDEHEDCEPEFVELLKRSRVKA
jgi:hypothetical protein